MPGDTESPRVLVVEDEADIREQVAHALVSDGFEVQCARDGEEGISILREHPSFDLIVLDLMMDGIDGWQFRVDQKADPFLATIPVVVVSASESAQARAIDADAYLAKPFDIDHLVRAVHHVLERRRSMHLERLALLGRVASGIAHEVNNPLAYILGNLAAARSRLTSSLANLSPESRHLAAELAEIDACIGKALGGVDRVRDIMQNVRLFGRAPDNQRTPIDLLIVIEASLDMMGGIDRRVEVGRELGPVPLMLGNPGQLGQLVVNLVANAMDAMARRDRRNRVTVRTFTSEKEEIVLEVEDNGTGMPEDVKRKIFEPFFTTKPPGVGTGLGLSISHGIVRSHGGTIQVRTKPGRGTCIRAVFPPAPLYPVESLPGAPKKSLLIVEDNPLVSETLVAMLATEYETRVAGDVETALSALGQYRPDEVILCDVHLDDMPTKELVQRLGSVRPELARRLIFMTGDAVDPMDREMKTPFLHKPFSAADLRRAIAELPSKA